VLLPSHGHVERTVEVSSPLRQIYDSINTFRRFPEWSAQRKLDPQVQITMDGPAEGEGAKVSWTSASPQVGNGSMTIAKSEQDSKITMAVDNKWSGENKTYTVTLVPAQNGKTVTINWAYDVDYGWNLIWRYAGLYIHGDPATQIQLSLSDIAAMLATFPNVDYKDQKIDVVDVTAKPVLLVSTKAKRTLDDVAEATDTAMKQIEAALKKTGLNAAGPRMTITTNWGEEDYAFSVAVPVDATTFTMDKQQYTIETPTPKASATDDEEETTTFKPGDKDDAGMLVIDDKVRAALWYQGKALVTEMTGSPAQLPLLRLMEKAYAETHGYPYAETGVGRFWDELLSPADAPEDQQNLKVYLPIQVQ
ncbi:MAG TPA: SRPBCC family protein, partial [Vicinamibacterales bacterium]|nr:SRPBCC family protein [Vicinamibacterales bacterium]